MLFTFALPLFVLFSFGSMVTFACSSGEFVVGSSLSYAAQLVMLVTTMIAGGPALPGSFIMSVFYLFAGPTLLAGTTSMRFINFLFYLYSGRFAATPFFWVLRGISWLFHADVASWIGARTTIFASVIWAFCGAAISGSFVWFYLVVAFRSSFSFCLAALLAGLPFLLFFSAGFWYSIFILVYYILTFDNSVLTGPLPVFGVVTRIARAAVAMFYWLGRGAFFGSNPVSFLFFLIRNGARIPADLWFVFVEDPIYSPRGLLRIRHRWIRFGLSLQIFISSMLGFWNLLFVILVCNLFLFGGAASLIMLHNPESFLWVLWGFCSSLFSLEVPAPQRFKMSAKRQYINSVLGTKMWLDPSFHHPGGLNIRPINPRVDAFAFTDAEVDYYFNYFNSYYYVLWFVVLLGFVLWLLRSVLVASVAVGTKVLLLPLRVLDAFFLSLIPWLVPDPVYDVALEGFSYLSMLALRFPVSDWWRAAKAFARVPLVAGILGVATIPDPEDLSSEAIVGGATKLAGVFNPAVVQMTRRTVLRFIERLDSMRLPEFIQAAYKPPSVESIRDTYTLMEEIGFSALPGFVDSIGDPTDSPYLAEWGSWRNWLSATSNFALGFNIKRVVQQAWLPERFMPDVAGYIHTGTYTSVFAELMSTARYWTGNDVNNEAEHFGDVLDGLIEGVRVQFIPSHLTPPEVVFRHWNKKYNFGFGFGEMVRGKIRQVNRRSMIERVGGPKKFMEAWKKVFVLANSLTLPSPVFTKMETLKVKKAIEGKVRTVVGSAFSEYVVSTIFNYQPNHNYKFWDVPAKVGMPINGSNFNRLWESMLGRSFVFAGDMTAFDSTQSPPVVRLVAALRKRGFEAHRDYHRICELVDLTYENVLRQPMGFKNFGDLAFKGQGFTTGHGSTTADNSLALLINYLFAWRMVTGLRSREFYNFNTLANFGDDHVLAYDAVFGWNPTAAAGAMARLGTIMRDEAPGTNSMPAIDKSPVSGNWKTEAFGFLSKIPLPLTPDVARELAGAGIDAPLTFATCHDPKRLAGKIKGQVLAKQGADSLRSYTVLLSYISLTSHHKEIYDELVRAAHAYRKANIAYWQGSMVSPKRYPIPPTYNEVLRAWYSAESDYAVTEESVFDPDAEEADVNKGVKLTISMLVNPDLFGMFARWISDFPTMLSPRYSNTRWADWLQVRLARQLSWPLRLIALANGTTRDIASTRYLVSRTPYAFLRQTSLVAGSEGYATVLVRHWLFMCFSRLFSRKIGFSVLSIFRMLDVFSINFVFAILGRVQTVIVELDVHVWETILIFLLSYVSVPLEVTPLVVNPPTPTEFVARTVSSLFALVTPGGSIDFQPFFNAVDALIGNPELRFVLDAPTGVGKSTRLMKRLVDHASLPVIVLVPRRLVAISVGEYMRKLYPAAAIGISTEGYAPGDNDVLIYATVQSFLQSPRLQNLRAIVVLDEAHIIEPSYMVMKGWLRAHPHVLSFAVTATPTPDLLGFRLALPAVSSFRKTVHPVQTVGDVAQYLARVSEHVRTRSGLDKILVFVNLISEADILAKSVGYKSCIIASGQLDIDPDAVVYIATSVADAGVTIPDVSEVFSMTHAYTRSKPDPIADGSREVIQQDSEGYYFDLSEVTRHQRAGRTGRTSDGEVFFFDVLRSRVDPATGSTRLRPYAPTLSDYANDLGPATASMVDYFPPDILAKVTPRVRDALPLVTGKADMSLFQAIQHLEPIFQAMRMRNPAMTFADVVRMVAASNGPKMEYKGDREIRPDGFPSDWDFDRPAVPGRPYTTLAEDKPNTIPPWYTIPRPPGVSPPVVMVAGVQADPSAVRLVDVSGAGLLCGARVLQGAIWTVHGFRVSIDRLSRYLSRLADPTLEAQSENFNYALIRDLGYHRFRVALPIIVDGRANSIPEDFVDFDAVVQLELTSFGEASGHYRYWGLPVPPGEDTTDQAALDWLRSHVW